MTLNRDKATWLKTERSSFCIRKLPDSNFYHNTSCPEAFLVFLSRPGKCCNNNNNNNNNNMWKQKAAQVILIVISSTGVIPKSLSQSLTRLNLHPNTHTQLQKSVILGTCSIVRNFLNYK